MSRRLPCLRAGALRTRTPAGLVSLVLLACQSSAPGDGSGTGGAAAEADFRVPAGRDAATIPAGETADLAFADARSPGREADGGAAASDARPGPDAGAPAVDAVTSNPDADRADARVSDCAEFVARGTAATRPTDIVWLIDGSPSMRDEIATVTANLNAFAATIGAAGVDARVIVVGPDQPTYPERDAQEFFPICVPPPLSGAPGCPDTDGDHYLHVRRPLHSREALAVGTEHLAEYRDFLRPGAATHVVVVTDDDERSGARAAAAFDAAFAPLAPGYVFHSVVDLVGYIEGCAFDDTCSCGENRGQTYIDLSTRTGGVVHSICDADWTPLFDALTAQVIDSARIPCGFALPDPRDGVVVDPEHVNVQFTAPDGTVTPLFNVGDAAGCAADPRGWYYDVPVGDGAPTHILLCDGACGARDGEVDIEMGCFTRKR